MLLAILLAFFQPLPAVALILAARAAGLGKLWLFCGFSGMISAVGSGARGLVWTAYQALMVLVLAAVAVEAAVYACCLLFFFCGIDLAPSFTLVVGTVCTISRVTSGWSSGSGRLRRQSNNRQQNDAKMQSD